MRTERNLASQFLSPRSRIAFLAGLVALSIPTRAQTVQVILKEKDYILGGGPIQFVSKLAVTDRGLPFEEVIFNTTNNAEDVALLRNGFLSISESTPVLVPGGSIRTFEDLAVDRYGNVAWPLTLQNTPGGQPVDAGIYWNTVNLVLEAGPCTAPQVAPGTTYTKFEGVRVNDNGLLLCIGDVNDLTISGLEDAIFLLQTDGKGNLLSESVVVQDTRVYSTFTTGITATGFAQNSLALNNRGDWMAQVVVGPPNTTDTGILLNGTVIVREGDPAPVPPIPIVRTFSDMRDPELDLNDFGEYVFNAILDTSDTNSNSMIVKGNVATGNQKFIQEGNTFLAIAPSNVLQFDSAPVYIANSGDVFWYCRSNGTASQDTFYWRNFDVIVQEGVTFVGSEIVSTLRGTAYAFHASRSGRFWIGEVTLQNSGDAVLLADFGAVVPVPGCLANPSQLTHVFGDARAGQSISLQMDQAQALGALPLLYFSTQPAVSNNSVISCGLPSKFGEILIGVGAGQLAGRLRGGPYAGVPVTFTINIPNDPALVDQIYWLQGMFWDVPKTSGQAIRLTNGMYVEIGAP